MTNIYLVRHGETDWNVAKKLQGSTDIPLNIQGKAQAEVLEEQLFGINFDAVYSSDLMRARETAEIISRRKNLKVNTHVSLRERSWGSHEGQNFEDLRLKYGSLFHPLIEEYDYNSTSVHPDLHQVESYASAVQRVLNYLMEIKENHKDKSILVVSHGGVLKGILLYMKLEQFKNFYVNNTAYLHIEAKENQLTLKSHRGITFS